MENIFIDSAEKFTRMADLAAAVEEYRYNALVAADFVGRMRNCHIEEGNGVKNINNVKNIKNDEAGRNNRTN